MSSRLYLLALVVLFVGNNIHAQTPNPPSEPLARQVTIHRDTFGVPHIFGKTDAAVVFGLAYAQCEDNFWQLESDYINALGRAAELEGERALTRALTYRLFEIERLSKAEYDRLPANLRALCDAFAAGVNHFIAHRLETKPPETKPRLLVGLEGWQVLAFARSGRVGGVNRLGLNANEIQLGKLEASDKAEAAPMNFDGERLFSSAKQQQKASLPLCEAFHNAVSHLKLLSGCVGKESRRFDVTASINSNDQQQKGRLL